jgi:hypothetical protein
MNYIFIYVTLLVITDLVFRRKWWLVSKKYGLAIGYDNSRTGIDSKKVLIQIREATDVMLIRDLQVLLILRRIVNIFYTITFLIASLLFILLLFT